MGEVSASLPSHTHIFTMNDNDIIVGNLGTVDSGLSELDAQRIFNAYRKTVHSSTGRTAWETVTWMQGGDVYKEYIPTLKVCFEGNGEIWNGVSTGPYENIPSFLWVQVPQLGARRVPASCSLPTPYFVAYQDSPDPSIARNCRQQVESHKAYHRGNMLGEEEMAAIALALLLPWDSPATYKEVGCPPSESDGADEEEDRRYTRIWDCIKLSTETPSFAAYRKNQDAWSWEPLGLESITS